MCMSMCLCVAMHVCGRLCAYMCEHMYGCMHACAWGGYNQMRKISNLLKMARKPSISRNNTKWKGKHHLLIKKPKYWHDKIENKEDKHKHIVKVKSNCLRQIWNQRTSLNWQENNIWAKLRHMKYITTYNWKATH